MFCVDSVLLFDICVNILNSKFLFFLNLQLVLLLFFVSRFGSLQPTKIVTEQVADTPVEYFVTVYVLLYT